MAKKHWLKTWDDRRWEDWHRIVSDENSTEAQRAKAKAKYDRAAKWGIAWAFLRGKM